MDRPTDRPTKSKSLSNCRRRLRLHGSIWTCVGNRSRSERREGGRQTFIARERADRRENITAQHVSIAAAANGKGFLLLYSRVSTERLTLRQKMLDKRRFSSSSASRVAAFRSRLSERVPMQMTPPIDLGLHHHQLSVSESCLSLSLSLSAFAFHDLPSSRAQKMSAGCPERTSERENRRLKPDISEC